MNAYNAQLPHELYILYLLRNGNSQKEIEDHLDDLDLAIPTTSFFNSLGESTLPLELNRLTNIDPIIDILHHNEREFIDVLCVLYCNNFKRLLRELEEYDININRSLIYLYRYGVNNVYTIYSSF